MIEAYLIGAWNSLPKYGTLILALVTVSAILGPKLNNFRKRPKLKIEINQNNENTISLNVINDGRTIATNCWVRISIGVINEGNVHDLPYNKLYIVKSNSGSKIKDDYVSWPATNNSVFRNIHPKNKELLILGYLVDNTYNHQDRDYIARLLIKHLEGNQNEFSDVASKLFLPILKDFVEGQHKKEIDENEKLEEYIIIASESGFNPGRVCLKTLNLDSTDTDHEPYKLTVHYGGDTIKSLNEEFKIKISNENKKIKIELVKDVNKETNSNKNSQVEIKN